MFPSTLPLPRLPAASQIPKLRWGIIGPGWIADHFANALRKHTHQQITAVAARDPAKAKAFADKWSISHATGSIDVLLAREDVDAVYIATPHNHHFPDGLRAIAAGKHLLIEKPLALNAQQATQLKQAAAAANLLCMEAMWCNFTPKYDVIRQLLEDGVLGDVHTLIADHGEFFTPDHRIFNADLAGGPMLDLGSYLVALSVFVGGGAPDTIVARGQPVQDGRVNGQSSMLFTHQHGMHSVLNTTLFSNTPGGAVIAGRKATLELSGQFYAPGNFTLTSSDRRHRLQWQEPASRYEQLCHEINHFAWCIGQNRIDSPIHSLDQAITTLAAMDNVRQQIGVTFNEEQQP
ncbi:Gfo/Idh/MocA family protein [Pantoea agglomerans]|uniref:Gfo/Idh/MocA family protein n=1 Tax=Enterobacter agglomerans TaxID=549 RepID=UPI000E21645F|nr:Gfo/Idh/MocA family oxidoreductase [Pantoea agglomerans]MCH9406610.1 Gfo/Idh/MocA family oxidoreductase [Pantoea agglomerans]WNK30401.1 Gfo/Idh/MocA family oxidoreductase [Pantoea agglomerans]WNK62223.1 Gfo/Idh/MocA family oxidoreductase [Pantoea agglomerans]